MPSRIIKATVTSGHGIDKKGGEYITFSVTADSGSVSHAVITSASLYLSSYRSYATTYYLDVIYGGNSGAVVASTGGMESNSTIHSSTEALVSYSDELLTGAEDTLTLGVVATSGTGNKINIREGCTLTLTINYEEIEGCTPPTTVTVTPNPADAGASATLSWSGAVAGAHNTIGVYAIYRSTTTPDGGYEVYDQQVATVDVGTDSLVVTAPGSMGATEYYKVAVLDTHYNAAVLSDAYAALTARVYAACTAPTSVAVSPASVSPGAKVTLSWSGAEAGENVPIAGYQIYRATSEAGEYSLLTTVATTATSGSTTVVAPTTNGATYYYKVLTLGTRSGYNSERSVVAAALACTYAATGAPTTLKVDVTNVAPGAQAVLSWSGASAGTNNAITGYEVYRADSAAGDYSLLATLTTAETYGSVAVTAPTASGAAYYYRVQTLGTLDGCDSGLSSTYTALTCTYSSPSAPTRVTIGGAASVYALPGTSVTLAWSGASAGANNPITGYEILRDGVAFVTGLLSGATSYSVPAHSSAGHAYQYAVVTKGTYSDSAPSVARTVYAYSDPTAPATVTVSNAAPVAGARVTLSWGSGAAGGYNSITGYRVYRATSVNGSYTLVASVTGTAQSCIVDAPPRAGYVYCFRVVTVGSYSSSAHSIAYAAVTAGEDTSAEDTEITVIVTPTPPRMKRRILLGDYDTAQDGLWTLAKWSLSEPQQQTGYVSVPWRIKGPLDLSTALTEGDPRYGSRTLTATLESSEGTRLERMVIILDMLNRLHGQQVHIVLPDDPDHYLVGRVQVKPGYNDLAHASVSITATCEPWRYSVTETAHELLVSETPRPVVLSNRGRCVLVPEIVVSGYDARVTLTHGARSWTLMAGTYRLPGLLLVTGNTELTYSGVGTVAITYREAVL